MIHLINENNQYIGSRELKIGETMPFNATEIMPVLNENMIAFLNSELNKWEYKTVEYSNIGVQPEVPATLEERVTEIEQVTTEVITILNDKGIAP